MFQLQPRFIGVDTNKKTIRFASLVRGGKGWTVSLLKEMTAVDAPHQFSHLKDEILVSALNTRDVLLRPCEIALKKQKDIKAALEFHVEPLLPYSLDKAIIQPKIVSQQQNSSQLNIFSVRKDHMSYHLEDLKSLHLEPEAVTTKPHALAAFSRFLPQTGTPVLMIHEGEDELSFVLVEKQEPLIFRSIEYKKDLTAEIQKTFLSFAAAQKNKNFDAIYFLGKNLELKTLLQQLSGKAVLFPSSPVLSLSQDELINFGLAIGIAAADRSINFRQKAFVYPKRFKRLKKPIVAYLMLTTILFSLICFFGEMHLMHKKEAIVESYNALLKAEKMAPDVSSKNFEDYIVKLNAVEKQIKGRPETFSLFPQVPKVKEVLSWLTALSKTPGSDNAFITLESMHYQMVKRPDFPHKKEKYKVRVDLEITAKDAASARIFQEALKNQKTLADTNEEIQWLPVKGKYKVSFYLKDKTKYG